MPFRRYAEFSGRSRRMEYWMWTLFIFVVYLVFVVLGVALGATAILGASQGSSGGTAAGAGGAIIVFALFGIFLLAIFLPSLAVAVRRLHDTDHSGWWILAPMIGSVIQVAGGAMHSQVVALVGGLVGLVIGVLLLVWYFSDGTAGANRFGPDPKGRGGPGGYDQGYGQGYGQQPAQGYGAPQQNSW